MPYTLFLLVCLAGTQPPCPDPAETTQELAATSSAAYVQPRATVAQPLGAHPAEFVERRSLRRGREA